MPQSTTPSTLERRPTAVQASGLFPTSTASPDGPALDSQVSDRIGEALRAHYRSLVTEPIPDRFAELVGMLDGKRDGESGR